MEEKMDNNEYDVGNLESFLSALASRESNVDKKENLEYNLDGCSCMSCGCFKSAWTVVLSPAGIAAGMAAYAADAAS